MPKSSEKSPAERNAKTLQASKPKQDHSQMPAPKRRRLVKKLTGLIDDASKLRDIIYKID